MSKAASPGHLDPMFETNRISTLLKKAFSRFKAHVPVVRQRTNPEFCKEFYLANNPDVVAARIDPLSHYLEHGKNEGRLGRMPEALRLGHSSLDERRETVLLVGHEASRTGAPVLTYNLACGLLKKYNVIVLFLGPGPMMEACAEAGAIVVGLPQRIKFLPPGAFSALIIEPYSNVRIKFAIANSIETRSVLQALSAYYIPTITLIHEFAAYTARAVSSAVLWSGQTVFSAEIVRDSYDEELADALDVRRCFPILPQGRCLLPEARDQIGAATIATAEAKRLKEVMRPHDFPDDGIVVLGAGTVDARKGVDLFVDCASRVHKLRPQIACRFVWVGASQDGLYRMLLTDQVTRAGLQDRVFVVDAVSDLRTAYALADIFVLSSRLDPLPNVAIDALSEKLPVVCFDRTTGIADFLKNSGLGGRCVASYLDTHDLARKIAALADSKQLRREVGETSAALSSQTFNMGRYVTELEKMAIQTAKRSEQERKDVEEICQSTMFQPEFFAQSTLQTRADIAREYVRSWATDIGLTKPCPGFHPGIYLEKHGVAEPDADPFADYLRRNRPAGPWNFRLVTPADRASTVSRATRVGLHVHAYYPELFPAVLTRLELNHTPIDLLVSVTCEVHEQQILAQLSSYQRGKVEVKIVPNRGRDIGPFLSAFGPTIADRYDLIGHVHTKNTPGIGSNWFLFLLEHLIGGVAPMADIILSTMANDDSIGMVFPEDPHIRGWTKNRREADNLAARLGITHLPEHFVFPQGTMFWARTSSLSRLFDLKLGWDDYPEEPLPRDGTILHALERLFPFVLEHPSRQVLLSYVPGVRRALT